MFAVEVVVLAAVFEAFTAVFVLALTAALLAVLAFTAVELVVAADALSALLTAGVFMLAAEESLAEPAAPRRICAKERVEIPKEAMIMVAAMMLRFIIPDF